MHAFARLAAAALFSLLVLLPETAQAQDRAALLTEVSGAVSVTRASGGAAVDASWGMQLFQGDVVRTGADGVAALLFTDNNLVNLGANTSMTVSTSSGQGRSVPSSRLADVSDLTMHRAGQGEIAALGGLRSGSREATIVPVTPRNSRVLESHPVLAWYATADFDEFEVRLLDGSGEVWSTTVTESQVTYPDDAPALEPGKEYVWQVTGIAMLDEIGSEMAPFAVVDDATRTTVREEADGIRTMFTDDSDASSRDYLLGALYAREGLINEAIQAFSRIAERHPDSPIAHEILGKLYYDMGMKDEAIQALHNALESDR